MPDEGGAKTSLFDAAKQVAEILSKMPKSDQLKVMRWVSESLGIASPDDSLHHAPALLPPIPASGGPISPKGQRDIRTFVGEKQPQSDNQFAATVAYFYRFEAPESLRRETIDATILQDSTRLVGRNRLGDPSKTLSNAVGRGYLDKAGTGEYRISTVGENLVAMTLPAGGNVGGQPARGPRKPSKKEKKSRK